MGNKVKTLQLKEEEDGEFMQKNIYRFYLFTSTISQSQVSGNSLRTLGGAGVGSRSLISLSKTDISGAPSAKP